MSIKLNVEEFNNALKKKGWSDGEAAKKMNISPVQIWRVRLPDDDIRHNDPGKDFIAGALSALNMKFEELFFLTGKLRCRNKRDIDPKPAA